MVCEGCEISLTNFSSLVTSWWKSNNHSHFDAKEGICNLKTLLENLDDISNSSAFEDSNDSVANFPITKTEQTDELQSTYDVLEDDNSKDDGEYPRSHVIKKQEIEENEEVEMQLKNEELHIKDEDDDV